MEKLGAFITGKFMHSVLLLLVVINAVILGLEAESALVRGYEPLIQQIDFIWLGDFEIFINLFIHKVFV